jgi:hypothetical protein
MLKFTARTRGFLAMFTSLVAASVLAVSAEEAKAELYFSDGTMAWSSGTCWPTFTVLRSYSSAETYYTVDVYNNRNQLVMSAGTWSYLPAGALADIQIPHRIFGVRGGVALRYWVTFARVIGGFWQYRSGYAGMQPSLDGVTCYGLVPYALAGTTDDSVGGRVHGSPVQGIKRPGRRATKAIIQSIRRPGQNALSRVFQQVRRDALRAI